MDTQCVITVYSKADLEKLGDVFSYLRGIERMISRYEEGSEVFRINEAAGVTAVKVSEETFSLIAKAKEISLLTGGAFNPLLGKISDMWNFTGTEHRIPSHDELENIIAAAGDMDNLVLDEEHCSVYLASPFLSLDLGGIAKGYASGTAAADRTSDSRQQRRRVFHGGERKRRGCRHIGSLSALFHIGRRCVSSYPGSCNRIPGADRSCQCFRDKQ